MTVTTLAYTGAVQSYTIPAGVTSVTLECWGGGDPTYAGKGGYSKGTLIAAPGTVLQVYVGGWSSGGTGGWNGGGDGAGGGGGGGGGTDVRVGGITLANRVIVAGGGGGSANFGGDTGGGTAGGGTLSGTRTTGYALGQGGPASVLGGGGGGGYYGGFGGYSGSGGGGGSGYTGASILSPSMTNGLRSGNGQVVITAVNTAPLAPTLNLPVTNAYIFAGDTTPFTWAINDPDAGDYQTVADFRYKKSGDVSWTTGAAVASTVSQFVMAANTWTAGFLYEWQVSTYDNAGLQSPWSASSFANVIATLAAPTITAPTAGSSQGSSPVTLMWTVAVGASESYQTQRTQNADGTGTLYTDSGTVVSTATTALMALDPVIGRTDYLRVRFYYRTHWSPWASVAINNQYGPPQTPLLVCTPNPAKASVSVTITNPAASGGFAATASNDITRTSPDGMVDRIAKGLAPNATYVDGMVGAGVNDYKVTAYAASGSTAVSA
jgi:hypothetical protein